MSALSFPLIRLSITSWRAIRTQLMIPPNEAGSASTARAVATRAMPCRKSSKILRYLLDGQGFSQHRFGDRSPQCRCRGVQGGTRDRFRQPDRRGSCCHSVRHVRAWPVSGYEERGRHRVVQNPGAAQRASHGAVVSRWFAGDAMGCAGPYNQGDGIRDPWLDQDMQPLAWSEAEIDEVVAFLASLTSLQYKEQGIRELDLERARSRTDRPQSPLRSRPAVACLDR